MDLCIIGQEKSESNIKLLEEAKKHFGSVFFIPISSIHIGLTDKFSITYRTTDILKFKAILPRIPKRFYSYAYQLLSLFPEDTFTSIKPISFLLSSERFFLLTILRKRGIDTINLRLTHAAEAATRILKENNFPLILRTSEKKTGIFVENKIEAKSVIDALISLKQPILIEDVIEDIVSVYVAKPDILAIVKKKTKEKDIVFTKGDIKKTKISIDAEQLALDTASSVEAQIVRVDLSLNTKPKVVNIELNPDLILPSNVTDVNLPKKIIEHVHKNYNIHLQKPMLMKFFEDAGSVVKDVLKTKQLL